MAPPPLDVASPRLAGGGLRGALSAPGGSTLVGRAPAPTAGATLPHAMRAWLERCASSPHAGEAGQSAAAAAPVLSAARPLAGLALPLGAAIAVARAARWQSVPPPMVGVGPCRFAPNHPVVLGPRFEETSP
ncbi:unnamed protein product, partial [Prorocentrum cordatum]